MKKVIAIFLFVLVGLNAVAIFVRMGQGESVGSPAYLLILLVMLVGGFWLYPNKDSQQELQES